MKTITRIKSTSLAVFTVLAVLTGNKLSAQANLVKNPGFENLIASQVCPTTFDQLDRCDNWYSSCSTPDYFNICGMPNVSVPANSFGNQMPASGYAYAGFVAFKAVGANYREYLGSKLLQPLVPGTRYTLSMKVSMAEAWRPVFMGGSPIQQMDTCPTYIPCNKLGMKFYTKKHVSLIDDPTPMMNNQAHLFTNTIISDTLGWTTISGTFVADSAYTDLMIGNFFSNDFTDTITNPCSDYESYYYLDDISVSVDNNLYTGIATVSGGSMDINVYPNPANTKLTVNGLPEKATLSLISIFGETVYSGTAISNQTILNLTPYAGGMYYLKIKSVEGEKVLRIIKE